MSNSTLFYRMSMHPDESGLVLITEKFVSLRETAHMHFCVSEFNHMRLRPNKDETEFEAAKRQERIKIVRIHKQGSRIACKSEAEAFEALKYRKKRQVQHLRRDLAITEKFIELTDGKSVDDFLASGTYREIPDTSDLVNSFYRFD